MNAVLQHRARTIVSFIGSLCLASSVLVTPGFAAAYGQSGGKPTGGTVKVSLSEWKVQLTPATVPAGTVTFEVSNAGTIPHAFEVEGHGLEKSIPQIKPGTTATLKVNLRAGSYETYCPIGKGSHKMLGMMNHLMVGNAKRAAATDEEHEKDEKYETGHKAAMEHREHEEGEEHGDRPKMMKVVRGGPVIQILPGPFPFADSAMAVINNRPADQQADLTHKAHMGPYSNNVATISGDIAVTAIDRGATGDSVSGVAEFTAQNWEESGGQHVSP